MQWHVKGCDIEAASDACESFFRFVMSSTTFKNVANLTRLSHEFACITPTFHSNFSVNYRMFTLEGELGKFENNGISFVTKFSIVCFVNLMVCCVFSVSNWLLILNNTLNNEN